MKKTKKKISLMIKPVNGKLLQADLELIENIIEKISLTGDFFVYPEDKWFLVEKFLLKKEVNLTLINELEFFLKTNNIILIGFTMEEFIKSLIKQLN